jgi:16S rRNA (uracil1498-N3)-methyltransferase
VVPRVAAPVTFQQYLDAAGSARVVLVEPAAAAGPVASLRAVPAADRVELVVGPEGGWTSDEIAAAARSGCMLVSLAAGTLRADATPLVVVSALRALWNDL